MKIEQEVYMGDSKHNFDAHECSMIEGVDKRQNSSVKRSKADSVEDYEANN